MEEMEQHISGNEEVAQSPDDSNNAGVSAALPRLAIFPPSSTSYTANALSDGVDVCSQSVRACVAAIEDAAQRNQVFLERTRLRAIRDRLKVSDICSLQTRHSVYFIPTMTTCLAL